MNRIGIVAAAVSLLSNAAVAGPGASKPTGGCTAVWVTAPAPPGKETAKRRSLSFSARDVLDLELHVAVPSTSPAAGKKIELKLITPRGHLYQMLSAAAETEASPRRQRFAIVSASLPVAGTTIVNNSLYGTWRAEAYVEGESAPCAKPRAFEIQP
jgi:hypothetical protein